MSGGGYAFPSRWFNDCDLNATAPDGQVVPPGEGVQMPGMSLRDYFAAKALPIAYDTWGFTEDGDGKQLRNVEFTLLDEVDRTHVADLAYAMADAMLKARSA